MQTHNFKLLTLQSYSAYKERVVHEGRKQNIGHKNTYHEIRWPSVKGMPEFPLDDLLYGPPTLKVP
jgi:hypothetical protein